MGKWLEDRQMEDGLETLPQGQSSPQAQVLGEKAVGNEA